MLMASIVLMSVGWMIVLLRSRQLIWVLLGLEVMNLAVISYVVQEQSMAWLLFLMSIQVMESVLLIVLAMLSMVSWTML